MDRVPIGAELSRDAAGLAQEFSAIAGIGGQTNHQALGRLRASPALTLERFAVLALAAKAARDLAQRDFAQRGQVGRLEKVFQGVFDLRRWIDFALTQPLAQRLDGDVDVDDLVGAREKGVRHGLAHVHAGEPLHRRVEALDVLDIHRGDHVDFRREQLLDVLVALFMLGAGNVGVRELIDHRDVRLARQDRVDVHLFHRDAAVIELPARDHFQVPELGHGVGAPVRFDEAEHDVDALIAKLVRLFEHPPGLADAGRGAHVNLEPALALLSDQVKEGFGRGALLSHIGKSIYAAVRSQRAPVPSRSRVRLRSRTLMPGSPKNPARRGRRLSRTTSRTAGSLSPRAFAIRGTWSSAAAGEISGSKPLPDAVTMSTGTCAGEIPGFSSSTLCSAALVVSTSLRLVGPRLEPLELLAS